MSTNKISSALDGDLVLYENIASNPYSKWYEIFYRGFRVWDSDDPHLKQSEARKISRAFATQLEQGTWPFSAEYASPSDVGFVTKKFPKSKHRLFFVDGPENDLDDDEITEEMLD